MYEKAKLSLRLDNYEPIHEATCESDCTAPPFLTPAIYGGKWSASCPRRFMSKRQSGPRVGLDAVGKKQFYFPCRRSNSDTSAFQPILYPLSYASTLSRNLAL